MQSADANGRRVEGRVEKTAASYRYPFPPYPTGWYLLTESAFLQVGDVMPLRYFGRELVLFRTQAGEAVLLDAFCPHLGAHLGYGGQVEGEGIRCPFHSWRFDVSGRCDDVPYKTTPGAPDAGTKCWPLHEASGLISVYYSERGRSPEWGLPDQPFWRQLGWIGYETRSWNVRVHVQDVTENIADTTHFVSVHGLRAVPPARVETKGHIFHQVMGDDTYALTQVAYGLGLAWLEVEEPVRYRLLVAATPIDEEHVELRLLFLVDEGPGATELSSKGWSAVELISGQTSRDVVIWEHKVFRERPLLVPGDGAIGVFRKWAKQFYETATPAAL
ncbi:MAG: Rieske 2Fe-2S domain-containing protein [Acidimicrobiales bacterium]